MSRTTIRIDDELLAEAKAFAARKHRSLNSVVEDALRQALRGRPEHHEGSREPFRLHTFHGHGLRPGVDLDDSAALLDLMDEDETDRLR